MKNKLEAKEGMMIRFIKKSNSAYISRLNNDKFYFISEINKQFLGEDTTPIKNGEVFFITKIDVLDKTNRLIKINLFRKKDNTECFLREEDIVFFGG